MKIAIIGATGLVGRTMLEILHEQNLCSHNKIYLYASKRSAGKVLTLGKTNYVVRELAEDSIEKVDYALFSAGKAVSKQFAPLFVKQGAIVIDNSCAFRRYKSVPLVVPEINFNDITAGTKIIANPNCSTIALALPMFAISKIAKIKRIVVSTYQAVSGAGQNGLVDLEYGTTNKFPHPITNNLIPHIDKFLPNGYTFEEDKMNFELKKILHDNSLKITTTAVRVPITNSHSESVNIELNKNVSTKSIKEALSQQAGVLVVDNPKTNLYPMPKLSNLTDYILVGRIRKDYSLKHAYNLFLCMNNIRKGAALNAVQIMQKLMRKNANLQKIK